jgi:hypothetical protein
MLIAIIIGILVIAGGENLSRLLGLGETVGTLFIVVGFFLMGLLMAFVAPSGTNLSVFVIYACAAIIVGDLVDVCVDLFFRSRDRNLWPLEIIVLGVLCLPPLIVGVKIIRTLKRRRD